MTDGRTTVRIKRALLYYALKRPGQDTAPDARPGHVAVRRTVVAQSLFPDPMALEFVCRRHHIRRLALFGSTLKGTNRSDSDVDLLVEFEPEAKPSLLTMAQVEIELSPLVGGRKVDLRTAQDLSRYFRDEVVRTAEVQYEAR